MKILGDRIKNSIVFFNKRNEISMKKLEQISQKVEIHYKFIGKLNLPLRTTNQSKYEE